RALRPGGCVRVRRRHGGVRRRRPRPRVQGALRRVRGIAVPRALRRVATLGSVATSVLPLDDHPSFRATARLLLEAEGHAVVGEAGDGLSGISKGELSDAALAAAGAMTALKRALWTIGAAAVALGGVAIALVATSDHEATR